MADDKAIPLNIRSVNDINIYSEIDEDVGDMSIDVEEEIGPTNTTINDEQRNRIQNLLLRDPKIQQEIAASQNLRELLEQRDNTQGRRNKEIGLPSFSNNNRNQKKEERKSPKKSSNSPPLPLVPPQISVETEMNTQNSSNQVEQPIQGNPILVLPQVGRNNNQANQGNRLNENNIMQYQERGLPPANDTYTFADRTPYFDGSIDPFDIFEQALLDMEINLNNEIRDHS